MSNYAAVAAAHREAGQVAQSLFDKALEAIEKTAPHFVPVTYGCVWIADGYPTGRRLSWNDSFRHAGISEGECALARQYCDDHVKFCLKNHLSEAQRDDVMIIITGFVPMNESVAPNWDENTPEAVRKHDARLIMDAHCYFQSELK